MYPVSFLITIADNVLCRLPNLFVLVFFIIEVDSFIVRSIEISGILDYSKIIIKNYCCRQHSPT